MTVVKLSKERFRQSYLLRHQILVNDAALSLLWELCGAGGDVTTQNSSFLRLPGPSLRPSCHLAALHWQRTSVQNGECLEVPLGSKPVSRPVLRVLEGLLCKRHRA